MDASWTPGHEAGPPLVACWLGRIDYRAAWALQKRLVGARSAGALPDVLLVLEHDPVLTLGRGADPRHVLADATTLANLGIDVIPVERGGEVTYHGPGQLVAYPIVRLADRRLLVRPFVRALESALAETCRSEGVSAGRRDGHPGVWCDPDGPRPRKIGALGLRIERGVSYHGIALNVQPDLSAFDLINPCGLPGVSSTSIAVERGQPTTAIAPWVEHVGRSFAEALAGELRASLRWAARRELDGLLEPRLAGAARGAR